jgi:hypothetical protein
VVEHLTADQEVTGSNPVGPCFVLFYETKNKCHFVFASYVFFFASLTMSSYSVIFFSFLFFPYGKKRQLHHVRRSRNLQVQIIAIALAKTPKLICIEESWPRSREMAAVKRLQICKAYSFLLLRTKLPNDQCHWVETRRASQVGTS